MKALRYLAELEQERTSGDNKFIPQKAGAKTLNVMFVTKVAIIVFH
jgi:hypothetical protein